MGARPILGSRTLDTGDHKRPRPATDFGSASPLDRAPSLGALYRAPRLGALYKAPSLGALYRAKACSEAFNSLVAIGAEDVKLFRVSSAAFRDRVWLTACSVASAPRQCEGDDASWVDIL